MIEACKNYKIVSILDPFEKGAKESLEKLTPGLTDSQRSELENCTLESLKEQGDQKETFKRVQIQEGDDEDSSDEEEKSIENKNEESDQFKHQRAEPDFGEVFMTSGGQPPHQEDKTPAPTDAHPNCDSSSEHLKHQQDLEASSQP